MERFEKKNVSQGNGPRILLFRKNIPSLTQEILSVSDYYTPSKVYGMNLIIDQFPHVHVEHLKLLQSFHEEDQTL